MKKTIFAIGFCMFLAVAGNAQNQPTANAQAASENKNQADMKFEADEYTFGTIKQGETVNYDFKFTNTGKEPLIISEAHGSCGCTVPEWPKEPIKKGQSGVIKVTFNSAGKMGPQDKTVTITSNAKSSPKILHIKGNIVEKTADNPATPNKL